MFISKDLGGKSIGYLEHCRFRSIDGLIVFRAIDKEIQEVIDSSIPCVVIDFDTDQASTIYSDNFTGSYLAVKFLKSLGHTKIAHIYGEKSTFAGSQRKQAFENALEKLGIPRKEDYLVDGGYFSVRGGYDAMVKLLQLEDIPTAVFAAGDYMAIGAMRAAKDCGQEVPEDISIIGFDDIDISKFVTPSLTTIRQNTHLLGKNAAKILIDMIENKAPVHTEVIPVELVKRDSCTALINR
jgi:DNA-binding LacI/PurR family transcriptional regulator